MECMKCGDPIPTIKGCAHEITAFEETPYSGGTNPPIWKKRTGNVLCPACTQARKLNIDPNQMSLV